MAGASVERIAERQFGWMRHSHESHGRRGRGVARSGMPGRHAGAGTSGGA
jgi:hypothetical protein